MQKPHALVWRSQSGSQTVTIAVIPGPGWTVSPVSESFIYSHCCAAVAHLYTPLPPRAGSQSVSCKLVGWLVCSFAQVVWRSATLLRSLGRLVFRCSCFCGFYLLGTLHVFVALASIGSKVSCLVGVCRLGTLPLVRFQLLCCFTHHCAYYSCSCCCCCCWFCCRQNFL